MIVTRISAALAVSALLLSGGTALAGPRGAGAQAPPVHTWSTLPPAHFSRMKPFVAPKRFVPLPAYVPFYLPSWGGQGSSPFLLGGFGATSSGCQPQTLGDLGAGGSPTGFAPVALGAPAFDSLESAPAAASLFSPQAYCQPSPLGWSSFNFGF